MLASAQLQEPSQSTLVQAFLKDKHSPPSPRLLPFFPQTTPHPPTTSKSTHSSKYVPIIKLTKIQSFSQSPKDKYIIGISSSERVDIKIHEPHEFISEGKIPNAINIPLSTLQEKFKPTRQHISTNLPI